jgi:hypothetical protein
MVNKNWTVKQRKAGTRQQSAPWTIAERRRDNDDIWIQQRTPNKLADPKKHNRKNYPRKPSDAGQNSRGRLRTQKRLNFTQNFVRRV